jgi:acetylglutamate kinase
MTDVEGVQDATGQVIGQLDFGAVEQLLASPFVTGGMKPKLRAVLTALAGGVAGIAIAGPSRHASVLFDGKGGTNLVAA